MLGKFIALAEWKIACAVTGEAFCPEICAMMERAADRIWESCPQLPPDSGRLPPGPQPAGPDAGAADAADPLRGAAY